MFKRSALLLTLTAATCFPFAATAQSAAQLAPADAEVFIHLDGPDEWFAALADGPMGDRLREQIETESDFGILLALLGMDFDQFMASYFGDEVVIVGPDADEDDDTGIIFTKVDQPNREHVIDSFALQRAGDIAGSPMYVSDDGNGYFIMMQDWLAFCDLASLEYLQAVLERDEIAPSLADTESYSYWTGMLPDDRAATVLILNNDEDSHALGVTRSGKLMDMTYVGRSPDFDNMMLMLGDTDTADFGPLPADTLAAISFNLKADANDQDTNELLDGLDVLAAPTSFTNDILPKLEAPTLVFLGSVAGGDIGLEVDLPVAGFAVKMNDPTAATDLQVMMDRLVLLANLATAEWQAGPIPFRAEQYNGASMRIAEIGKPVAKFAEWPELEPVQLVYGQVGDYYVVCTQEQYFKDCVDANAGGKPLRMREEGPGHPMAVAPIMVMSARPDGFAQLLRTWLPLIEEGELPNELEMDIQAPGALSEFREFIQLIEQYSSLKLQLWRGEDGLLIGRGQLVPPF